MSDRTSIWLLVAALLLDACGTCGYFYDGGATARPYYKACKRGNTTTVVCDSPNRLPNSGCQ